MHSGTGCTSRRRVGHPISCLPPLPFSEYLPRNHAARWQVCINHPPRRCWPSCRSSTAPGWQWPGSSAPPAPRQAGGRSVSGSIVIHACFMVQTRACLLYHTQTEPAHRSQPHLGYPCQCWSQQQDCCGMPTHTNHTQERACCAQAGRHGGAGSGLPSCNTTAGKGQVISGVPTRSCSGSLFHATR